MKRRPKVRQDVGRPMTVIKTPPVRRGRRISEVIAAMKASGTTAVVDEDFAQDVEEAIRLHTQRWNPPSWD